MSLNQTKPNPVPSVSEFPQHGCGASCKLLLTDFTFIPDGATLHVAGTCLAAELVVIVDRIRHKVIMPVCVITGTMLNVNESSSLSASATADMTA